MSTNRRMSQQSRRQLESADTVRISYVSGQDGYQVITHREPERCAYVLASSDGAMHYDTPELAVRAIRRVRPDLSSADIPITWESSPGLRDEMDMHPDRDDSERILEDLHEIQRYASELVNELERDPATDSTRHHFRANSLLARLHALEHDLLASPPSG